MTTASCVALLWAAREGFTNAIELWHQKGLEHFPWDDVKEDYADLHQDVFLAMKLCWANYQVWHAEDYCRSGVAEQIVKYKPIIDVHNQIRNDIIEAIDAAIAKQLPVSSAPYYSDTPGSIIDRISVSALKVYHWNEMVTRDSKFRNKRDTALNQQTFLFDCLKSMLVRIASGKSRIMPFYQLKMYNDPSLNSKHKDAGK